MIFRYCIATVLMVCGGVTLSAQESAASAKDAAAAKGYYRNPLNMPMVLSANFGEFRSNHFHSGLDIKVGGVEGAPVYAAADGYISRVGIVPSGFGRALYIAHPNGTTTVYGHLQRFTDPMEQYAAEYRYNHKRHNADIFPESGRFRVKQGELIGYAGNSGMSYGPHLHFEVRESAMQRPVNVLAAGYYSVADNIAPLIEALYWVQTDTLRGVPLHVEPQQIALRKTGNNLYTTADTAATQVSGNGYFVVRTLDRKQGAANNMGVYRIIETVDSQKIFEYKMDRFQFASTRFVNAVEHYTMQRRYGGESFKLVVQENNFIPVYHGVQRRGVIMMRPGQVRNVRIEVQDDCGNSSAVQLRISPKVGAAVVCSADTVGMVVNCKREFKHSANGASVTIGAGALYESIFYNQSMSAPLSPSVTLPRGIGAVTPIYTIHRDDVPLHKAIALSIRVDKYMPEALFSKLTLARLAEGSSTYTYAGGRWKGGYVTASLRSFGRYCVVCDTIAPRIEPSFKEGDVLTSRNSISFVVSDNFSGIESFTGTLDGKWILFEYDILRRRITHYFDNKRTVMGGRHSVQLEVRDRMGNVALYDGGFTR